MYQYRYASTRLPNAGERPPSMYSPARQFAQASGLRRSELLGLCVRDIYRDEAGSLWIRVPRGRGRSVPREVPILPEHEQLVLRFAGQARILPDVPRSYDGQGARKEYARHLYSHRRKEAPQSSSAQEVDEEAAHAVMQALGHPKLTVVKRYYLGLPGHGNPHGRAAAGEGLASQEY
jgi:integrase